jgi:hypothetical protein
MWPIYLLIGSVAQLVEQRTLNPLVMGSNPIGSTKTKNNKNYLKIYLIWNFISRS